MESVSTLIISPMPVRDFIHLIHASWVSEDGNYQITVCMTQLRINVVPQSLPSWTPTWRTMKCWWLQNSQLDSQQWIRAQIYRVFTSC